MSLFTVIVVTIIAFTVGYSRGCREEREYLGKFGASTVVKESEAA